MPAQSPAQGALASDMLASDLCLKFQEGTVTGLCRPTKVLAGHRDQDEGVSV